MLTQNTLLNFLDDPSSAVQQFNSLTIDTVKQRASELLTALTVAQQLCTVVDSGTKLINNPASPVFQSLQSLLSESPHPFSLDNEAFVKRLSKFFQSLQPVENNVIVTLSSKLSHLKDSPSEAVSLLSNFSALFSRPIISKGLHPILENICDALIDIVNKTASNLDSTKIKAPGHRLSTPGVSLASYLHSLLQRTISLRDLVGKCLSSCSAFPTLASSLNDLKAEIIALSKDLYAEWVAEVNGLLKNNDLAATLTGRVLELSTIDGTLQVCFPESALTLYSQAREFKILGYDVPNSIMEAALSTSQYYHYVTSLKQVATFYNNINSLVIKSQKNMLLKEAVLFESIVKSATTQSNQGRVTWSNMNELASFVGKLHDAADVLNNRIRSLTVLHEIFESKLVELINSDLVSGNSLWKEHVDFIKITIQKCLKDGLDVTQWTSYWEDQLWVGFCSCFKTTLSRLPSLLTPIDCSLIVSNNQIDLSPSISELRQRYYREIRRILSLPLSFSALTSASFIEKSKVLFCDSSSLISALYSHVEGILSSLGALLPHFSTWIPSSDSDLFSATSLQSPSDWQEAHKLLKSRSKQVAKIPDNIKVSCISLSLSSFKSFVESSIKSVADGLITNVVQATTTIKSNIEEFLIKSEEELNKKAETLEDIGEAANKAKSMAIECESMRSLFTDIEIRNTLLQKISNFRVDISELSQQWNRFLDRLNNQDQILEQQKESFKSKVTSDLQIFKVFSTKFISRWIDNKIAHDRPSDPHAASAAMKFANDMNREAEELGETMEKLVRETSYFNIQMHDLSQLKLVFKEIKDCCSEWTLLNDFSAELEVITKEPWFVIRTRIHVFEDFLSEWSIKLKDQKSQSQGKSSVLTFIGLKIATFNTGIPVLKCMRGDIFTHEHWHELFHLLGISRIKTPSDLLFNDLLEVLEIAKDKEVKIKDLQARAHGEVSLREALQEVSLWANEVSFELISQTAVDGKLVFLIKDFGLLKVHFSDREALLLSLTDSPYFSAFSTQVESWTIKLNNLSEILHGLVEVQRQWLHLQPVLLRNALPTETAGFQRMHARFIAIMETIKKDCLVFSLLKQSDLSSTLSNMSIQLSKIQSKLLTYLDEKRQSFPKFYFIGDEDLLEIIGQAQDNPEIVLPHLKKLFQGINQITIENQSGNSFITHFISAEGESVKLDNPVQITGTPSEWLSLLSEESKNTLRRLLFKCRKCSVLDLNLEVYPAQILCLANSVRFATSVEQCISHKTLPEFKLKLHELLSSLTNVSSSNDYLQRVKARSLVLDLIYQIEVVDNLIENKVNNVEDWLWQQHLRFYIKDNDCVARCCNGEFKYTFEYQGNAPKLVHTPLTTKCYVTLTQALVLGLGGNPYGPAGTGKTETIKALAQALGRQCLVFNCDEGLDFKSMARIFIGLLRCGSWGCFDEFNRLDLNVLSAVSQQIQVIQDALYRRADDVMLLNSTVTVDHNAGIFVTLNPAGKGYGGRSVLPDNLKSLFRSIAMSKPDVELIAQVLLQAEGFKNCRILSKQIVSFFSLAKVGFSNQQHYDWGLRALKTTLSSAGSLLLSSKINTNVNELNQETVIIVKSLRLNTLPKLTADDVTSFESLVKDCFTNVEIDSLVEDNLKQAINEAFKDLNIVPLEEQFEKVLQLKSALEQKIGVVVVGSATSGKTILWKVLYRALLKVGHEINLHLINPKAMHRTSLLGHLDLDTREWHDGVLTQSAREVMKKSGEAGSEIVRKSWIICDGDIDPEWIEALNSVLDDNKLLTLPSGERIQFDNSVNFLFETSDLKHASPATISRMGMILVVPPPGLCSAILKSVSFNNSDLSFIDEVICLIPNILELVANNLVYCSPEALVISLLKTLPITKSLVEIALFASIIVSSVVKPSVRAKISSRILQLFKIDLPHNPNKSEIFYDEFSNLLSHSIDDLLGDASLFLTPHSKLYSSIIKKWMSSFQSFILIGPHNSCKDTCIKIALEELKQDDLNFTNVFINCSSNLKSMDIISVLKNACISTNTGRGKSLKSKQGSKIFLYLRHADLILTDKYGSVEAINLIVQLLSAGGFHDPSTLDFVTIEGLVVALTCSSQGDLDEFRSKISSRIFTVCRVLYVPVPTTHSLKQFTQRFAEKILTNYSLPQLPSYCDSLVSLVKDVESFYRVYDHSNNILGNSLITMIISSLPKYINLLNTGTPFLHCFLFEINRLIENRIVSKELKVKLRTMLTNHFGDAVSTAKQSYFIPIDFRNVAIDRLSHQQLKTHLSNLIRTYQREVGPISLVPTDFILDLFVFISNNLVSSSPFFTSSQCISALSGSGRRSVVLIAAMNVDHVILTPQITKGYSVKNFKAELRSWMSSIVGKDQKSIILIEDHQLVDDGILEILHHLILNQGVSFIFSNEDVANIVSSVSDLPPNTDHLQYFKSKIRENTKILILLDVFNPRSSQLLTRFPALYTYTAHFYSDSIPSSQLLEVPLNIHSNIFSTIPEYKSLVKSSIKIQSESSKLSPIFSAPRFLFSLFDCFTNLYQKKTRESEQELSRLQRGLDKLKEAAGEVAKLNETAAQQRILLSQKQAEADEALEQIQLSMTEASFSKQEAERLSTELAVEEKALEQQRSVVNEQLSVVEPMIQAARDQVTSIRSDHLAEIKNLRQPPEPIYDVLEGVLRLLGQPDASWQSMKKFIGKMEVKDIILHFDARTITPGIAAKVKDLLSRKARSFMPEVITRVSQAAAPLAAWVKANVAFSEVLLQTAPLEKKASELDRRLEVSRIKYRQCTNAVVELDRKIEKLKQLFQDKTGQAEILKINLEKQTEIIAKASTLLEKLSSEKDRWNQRVEVLSNSIASVAVNCMYSASVITFLPSTDATTREIFGQKFAEILGLSSAPSIESVLCSERELLQWQINGLSSDKLSIQNGVSVINESKVPLIIDPSGQVLSWLSSTLRLLGKTSVEIVSYHDQRFITTLELAVRFGKTLIVTSVDRLDPLLVTLLRKELTVVGSRSSIKIGDHSVDFNPQFQLFLFTENSNAFVFKCIQPLISTVSFAITTESLEEQLLTTIIRHELPDLETKRISVLKDQESLKSELVKVEEDLLSKLSESSGNILEDSTLISSLNSTKENAIRVAQSLLASEQLHAELESQRFVFIELAQYAAKLYSLISTAVSLNKFYGISVQVYFELFAKILSEISKDSTPSTKARLATAASIFKQKIWLFLSRGLLQKDRLSLGLNLVKGLNPDLVSESEWNYLFNTSSIISDESNLTVVIPSASASVNSQLVRLSTSFPSLFSLITKNPTAFMDWLQSETPESNSNMDLLSTSKFTFAQKLILIFTFRSDRFISVVSSCCTDILGPSFDGKIDSYLKAIINDVGRLKSILLISTPGADSVSIVREIVSTANQSNLIEVAMGQGQSDSATSAVRTGIEKGNWVFIKNVHLAIDWLNSLEQLLISTENFHPNFRIILATEPNNLFNQNLINQSVKFAFEPPSSLKLNVYNNLNTSIPIQKVSPYCHRALALASWLHTVIVSRLSFIPQGWSSNFEFSAADLRAACHVISRHLGDRKSLDESCLRYLIGLYLSVVYGSKVDQISDTAILSTLVSKFFSSRVFSGSSPFLPGFSLSSGHSFSLAQYGTMLLASVPDQSSELLCLASNSSRSFSLSESKKILSCVKYLSAGTGLSVAENKFDRSLIMKQLHSLQSLLSDLDLYSKNSELPVVKSNSPVALFIRSEINSVVKICKNISSQLSELSQILESDNLVNTVQLKSLANALVLDTIPDDWEDLMKGSSTPLLFLKLLGKRKRDLLTFFKQIHSGDTILNHPIDLSSFLNPATFINCLKQEAARKMGITIDGVVIRSYWTHNQIPSTSCFTLQVNNLLIQGATFSSGLLEVVSADHAEFSKLPACMLSFEPTRDVVHETNVLNVPVYDVVGSKDNVLVNIGFKINQEASIFILHNVSVFVDTLS
ncbi:hypothetical protein RCL1_005703 [Eukaryota sp. TZLM3-RCL]